jgi:type II secretory pathway component PulF
MPLFAYKGRALGGELVQGRLDAESDDQIAVKLTSAGITPIDIALAGDLAMAGPVPACGSCGCRWGAENRAPSIS